MELILTVVRYQGLPPQSPLTVRFGITGGTIGRNSDNDLVLADPDLYVGRQHARIGFRDGAFLLTDTSTNGTFLNNAAERLHRDQEVELHDGDELRIGDYEIRVSHEASQPQSAALLNPFAVGKPELEPLAHSPSGGPVPDVLDLVGGTPAEADPFPPPAAEQKVSAGPADWLTPAPPEEKPWTLGNEPESPVAPAPSTAPDHTPDANAFYSPPEAIPEDYDIWADESHLQPGEQETPIGSPEPLTTSTVPGTVPPVATPESPATPTAPGVAPPISVPESPVAPATPDMVPPVDIPESPAAPTTPGMAPPVSAPESPVAPTTPGMAPLSVLPSFRLPRPLRAWPHPSTFPSPRLLRVRPHPLVLPNP